MSELFLGIDLGGSHISSWLLDRNGKHYNPFSELGTDSSLGRVEFLNVVEHLVLSGQRHARDHEGTLVAVGFASPGPLDPNEGVIICPPNLPNLRNLEIIKLLRQHDSGLEAFLINDADAAVLGEQWLGSAQGFNNVVMLTLGTGVGSGVISGGKLQRGRGMGGEWGHTTVWNHSNPRDRTCSCGRKNCLEAFCGAEGLIRTYCNIFESRREDLSSEFVQTLSSKMKRGTDRWDQLLTVYCTDLAEGIQNIVYAHDPDCVILGGGIASSAILYRLKNYLFETKQRYGLDILLRRLEIRLACNEQPGIIGAAKYAMDCHDAKVQANTAE